MDKKIESRDFLRNFLAGLFFIAGIVGIVAVVFSIGQNRGLTQPKFALTVLFNNVDGLIEGAPVQLSGVNVGNVESIDFLDEVVDGRRVKVSLNIFTKYRRQFENDAKFSINTEGVLGEKFVDVKVIKDGEKIKFNEPILGEDTLDVKALTAVFLQSAESFTKAADEFSKIDAAALSKSLQEATDSLQKTSKGITGVLTELRYMTIKSKRILDRVEQKLIDGNLFKVF